MRKVLMSLAALTAFAGLQNEAQAGILVAQCADNSSLCANAQTPTPWAATLSQAQLASLGLGSTQDFITQETSYYVLRIGMTTAAFQTLSGPVIETLPEFNGDFHDSPPYETDVIGTFFIPADATSLDISGTFGNSAIPNTAPNNLFLGAIPAAVPEPATWALMLSGMGLVGYAMRKRPHTVVSYA